MVKMLSAAGARNVETRVRSSERRSSSNHNNSFINKERVEWYDEENEATHSPTHHHHHHGLRRSNTNNSLKEYTHNHNDHHDHKAERSELRSNLARPRLGNVVNKEKINDKFCMIKQRSRNGMDSMKQRSKRGFDTVRERTSKVLPRRPNIRLKSAPNKDLPTRSLFRHEPRTWFGAKKEKGDKATEDWRNSRPSQNGGGGSNSNIPTKKEGAHRGREEVYNRKPSDQGRFSGRRSRSASRRASFAEDDF